VREYIACKYVPGDSIREPKRTPTNLDRFADASAVAKSDPDFWDPAKDLGGSQVDFAAGQGYGGANVSASKLNPTLNASLIAPIDDRVARARVIDDRDIAVRSPWGE
jgi:hypothetical protein